MVKYNFHLFVIGNNFKPRLLAHRISKDSKMGEVDIIEKGDKLRLSPQKISIAKYSSISIETKKKFAIETEEILEQNKLFINFLDKHCAYIKQIGGEDIRLHISIYTFDTESINTEIFDRKQLKTIAKYNVALPLSIYYESIENFTRHNGLRSNIP